jgi:hypothetical protein
MITGNTYWELVDGIRASLLMRIAARAENNDKKMPSVSSLMAN